MIYIVIASWPRHQLSHTGSCIGTSLLIAPSRISSKWSHQMISIYYPLRMSAIWNLDEEMHLTSNCYRLETPSSLPWQFDVSWGRLSCTETSRILICSERLSMEVEVALISQDFKLQVKSEETTHGCMNVCLLCLFFQIVPFLMSRIFPQRVSSAFLGNKRTGSFGSLFVSFLSFISRRSSCGWSPSWTSGSSDAALADCWFRFLSCWILAILINVQEVDETECYCTCSEIFGSIIFNSRFLRSTFLSFLILKKIYCIDYKFM